MKKEEILKGNRLISEFMGGKFTFIKSHTPNVSFKKHPRQDRNFNNTNNADLHPKFLAYHKSWDWLMPVVEKIINIKEFDTENNGKHNRSPIYAQKLSDMINAVGTIKLEIVWSQVVEFIKWYNEQKTKHSVRSKINH